jgi:GNAT superfamily N-acetyltransferase
MTNELTIRTADLVDARALAELMTQLGYPTSQEEMSDRLAAIFPDPDYVTFVAEDRGKVVGMVGAAVLKYYEKNGVYGRVLTLVIDEARRGEGIGSLLIAETEKWLRDRSASYSIINCGKHRTDTHLFYEHRGYEATGLRFVKALS